MFVVFAAGCLDTAGDNVQESTSEAEGAVTAVPDPSLAITPGPIVNGASVLCLGIRGSSRQSGADALIGTCDANSATQHWHVSGTTTVGGLFGWQLANGVGKCLGVQGSSTASGAHVVQVTCGSTVDHSQIWRPLIVFDGTFFGFTADPGDGFYWLLNGHSGLCLGVHQSSTSSGALVVQGFCNSSSATQQWGL
jgi:hypothetical protein